MFPILFRAVLILIKRYMVISAARRRPGEPTRFIHPAHDTTAARAWALHNLDPDHQYAAALAYQDAPRSIRVITLSEPTELLT